MSNLDTLTGSLKKNPQKQPGKGIIDMACMNYAGVIRGDVLKNARVAKNCKDLAS